MARKQKARNLKKRRSVLIGAGPTEKAYIEHLTHLKGFEKTEKFLLKPGWVETLLANGRMQQAMRNADALGTHGESYTHIPDAIRFLEKHKKK